MNSAGYSRNMFFSAMIKKLDNKETDVIITVKVFVLYKEHYPEVKK